MHRKIHAARALLRRAVALFVLGACAAIAQAAPTFDGSLSGTWWQPGRAGEGQVISFEEAPDGPRAVLAWLTYDAAGAPLWLIGSGAYRAGDREVRIPLQRSSGGMFGPAFDAGLVQRRDAGVAVLEFVHCAALRLRYSGEQTFVLELQRALGPLAGAAPCTPATASGDAVDAALRAEIERHGLDGDPLDGGVHPGPDAPLARLGKWLFFSRSLGSGLDVACASCHHPALGGGDGLALSVGLGAQDPLLLGPGRQPADGRLRVGRNANTFFNAGLYQRALFWDGRVEVVPPEPGLHDGGIRTPDTLPGRADPQAGDSLLAAQARFPVAGATEMRDASVAALDDDALRAHLAARLGGYGSDAGRLGSTAWLQRFRDVFGALPAEQLVTFGTIARALAEYQRSALFVQSPWSRYVRGNLDAIDAEAKAGALLFFRRAEQGGAQCAQCHSGDLFSDEAYHVVGFPQVGPGAGSAGGDDHGRAHATLQDGDRHRFRTPSLLNVELTAPYGHAGSYGDLATVVRHYLRPEATAMASIEARHWCTLPPFDLQADCDAGVEAATRHTGLALQRLADERVQRPLAALPVLDPARFDERAVAQLVAFLHSLTDPCLRDRACIARWIPAPEESPDSHQLDARAGDGEPL